MFATALAEQERPAPALPASASRNYAGPDRRAIGREWLAAVLDELDYGLVLVTDSGHVVHANHVAQAELGADHPLQLLGRELRARHADDVAPLRGALQNAAQRGLRKLLTLGAGSQRVTVSVVPIGEQRPGAASTLLILGKRQVCESLSVQGYARSHRLTPAETRVLAALCQGVPPAEVAATLGVGIATVRSQIGSIRQKTGAESIRALVRQVAVLPPLMGVLGRTMMGSELMFRGSVAQALAA